MIIVKPEGAPACCRSEREFLRVVHPLPGVLIANANVPNSSAAGAHTREVDAILVTPQGLLTVEVKGLRAVGELHTPRIDAWSVVDGDDSVPLMGRPHAQALTHSKYLSSFLKDSGITPGWIPAVLAIAGDGIRLPNADRVCVVENVHVIKADASTATVIEEILATGTHRQELSLEAVDSILTAFGCVESAPTRTELSQQGFRTQSEIAAEIETLRQQARKEFLAATGPRLSADSSGITEGSDENANIADGPSTPNWVIDESRFRATQALDPDLSETGAIVNGVPLHRRLVAYATRKGYDLATVAEVVTAPEEILGDEEIDANRIYCGTDIAVCVRTIDGVALHYKPVNLARAEKQGVTIDGCEITARAAKQAINQFNIPLAAVARIVAAPQEQWWIPGTTDVAHARGDFVAVTAGPVGPVQYLMTRAVAISRANSRNTPPPPESPVDAEVNGLTLRASAVSWCQRRNVATSTISTLITDPQESWEGHSAHLRIHRGPEYAVLIDTEDEAIVAVMSASDAIEYRDGISKDGVRLSGRSLFLAKRRKVSVDDLIAARKTAETIARRPGTSETVYISTEIAVTVDDESGAVVEFTFARHARAQVDRGDLLSIDATMEPVAQPSTGRVIATFPSGHRVRSVRMSGGAATGAPDPTSALAPSADSTFPDPLAGGTPVVDVPCPADRAPSPALLARRNPAPVRTSSANTDGEAKKDSSPSEGAARARRPTPLDMVQRTA